MFCQICQAQLPELWNRLWLSPTSVNSSRLQICPRVVLCVPDWSIPQTRADAPYTQNTQDPGTPAGPLALKDVLVLVWEAVENMNDHLF